MAALNNLVDLRRDRILREDVTVLARIATAAKNLIQAAPMIVRDRRCNRVDIHLVLLGDTCQNGGLPNMERGGYQKRSEWVRRAPRKVYVAHICEEPTRGGRGGEGRGGEDVASAPSL